jgi:glycosyltransferase involved in cell wall biosynthesis
MSIIVTGHPYALPHYFRVFEYVTNKDEFVFVLPKVWKSKTEIRLEKKAGFNVYGLNAWSYGRRSFLGSAFKGWLPGMIFLLPHLKIKFGSRVLYSCSEPNLLTTLYNGLIAKILGLKLILFTWQNVLPENRMTGWKLKLSNALVAANLKLADGIICGNKKAEEIVKKFRKDIKTIVCPLSGVDTEKFRPGITSDWKEKLGLALGEKLILFCGALDVRKGLDVLIKAFDKICKLKTVNCKLIIVGTGSQKVELLTLADELGLGDRVVFLDWMQNEKLPPLLNSADIFVYPSIPYGGWEEQFGYAMAEASVCGVPVVATGTGSIGEVIVDGRGGILTEPNNPQQLANAIHKILSDDDLRKEMGEYGRSHIVKNFSHETVADKISSFLLGF